MLDITKYLETQPCSVPMILNQKLSFLVVNVSWKHPKEVKICKLNLFAYCGISFAWCFHYTSINQPLTISLLIALPFENKDTSKGSFMSIPSTLVTVSAPITIIKIVSVMAFQEVPWNSMRKWCRVADLMIKFSRYYFWCCH